MGNTSLKPKLSKGVFVIRRYDDAEKAYTLLTPVYGYMFEFEGHQFGVDRRKPGVVAADGFVGQWVVTHLYSGAAVVSGKTRKAALEALTKKQKNLGKRFRMVLTGVEQLPKEKLEAKGALPETVRGIHREALE